MVGSSPAGRGSPRLWHHVEFPAQVRPHDVLSFLASDNEWREGQVHSEARNAGREAAWWVVVRRWDGNAIGRACLLVERRSNGSLQEVRSHDLVPPVR